VLAFVVGALSNLWTIWLYAPETRLVGASGMLYGMVAMWLVLYVKFAKDYDVPMRIFRAIGVSLVLLFPTTFDDNTSYTAHATGFVVGWVLTLLVAPFLRVHEDMLVPEPEAPRHAQGPQDPSGIRREDLN
jgi:membrane associated rhomboid family serine protease